MPIVLHTISSLKKDTLEKAAPLALKGLTRCIRKAGPLRNEIMTSPDFWVILRSLSANPETAATVFEILESVTAGSPLAITADNYEPAVELLNSYASAGSFGVKAEPVPLKGARRQQKSLKPQ